MCGKPRCRCFRYIALYVAYCSAVESYRYSSRIACAWWRHQIETLIFTWINDWVNNREAGDLRRHRGDCDVNVMGYLHLDGILASIITVFKSIFINTIPVEIFCMISDFVMPINFNDNIITFVVVLGLSKIFKECISPPVIIYIKLWKRWGLSHGVEW